MKKLLLSMFCALGLFTANATTVTFNATTQGYENAEEVASASVDGVDITFDKGTNNNTPKYYTTGEAIRVYGGGYFTVAAPTGGTISEIVLTFGTGDGTNEITAEPGTYDAGTWTGSAGEVTFTVGGTSGHRRIQTITVTYSGGTVSAVSTPVISCAENMVSISCQTENAEVYYTIDGTTPSNASTAYTAPFAITKSVTVKAIAYLGTEASNVATYNAVYTDAFEGFEAFVEAGAGTEGTISGPITAVYQNGSYLYVVDKNDYPMLVYGSVSASIANGDQISSVTGKYSPYNGLPEITNPVIGTVTTGGTPVEPEVLAAEEMSADLVNRYVQFDNMIVTADKKAIDESGEITLYYRFDGANAPEDLTVTYTVRGFVSVYNGAEQLYPTEFIPTGDSADVVAAPEFNPAGGAVVAGTEVEITCATEGATIFYTVDGTEPTIASTEYVEPIVVTEAVTIKAIAVLEDYIDSKVVTASYTILDPTATTALFDFTDQAWLAAEGVVLPTEASTGTDIAGQSFTKNAIVLAFPANDASNKARIWRQTENAGGGVQLRVFAGDNFTISATGECTITGITFTCDNTYMNFTPNTGDLAADGTWTPADATCTSVTFSPSKASRINTIDVAYSNPNDGVSNVANDDVNSPVEYFNLQGVRVANPAAGQLVIKRQGSTVTKVLVK